MNSADSTACEGGYLAFVLGPVQPFIAASRTVRDLWAGSALLSWISFDVIRFVKLGYPDAVCLLPAERTLARAPDSFTGIPHRVSMRVPGSVSQAQGDALAAACAERAQSAWYGVAQKVRGNLAAMLRDHVRDGRLLDGWDKRWDEQVQAYFDPRACYVAAGALTPELAQRLLGRRIDAPDDRDYLDLANRVLESMRATRPVPKLSGATPCPGKCSLFGNLEQIGPDDLGDSALFWAAISPDDADPDAEPPHVEGIALRRGERLSALAAAKRFAPAVAPLQDARRGWGEHGTNRFPDTATVAAALWLERAGIKPERYPGWSGQWLHDAESAPARLRAALDPLPRKLRNALPSYYAVLAADGDNMGKWVQGKPPNGAAGLGLDTLSERLTRFSREVVPDIVEDHQGTLIYAGGDDVLAVFPAVQAMGCAAALRRAFSDPEQGLAPEATMSAGVTIVHHRDNLRDVLDATRDAERTAKNSGRDALYLHLQPHSGGSFGALVPWAMAEEVDTWRAAFGGISDRWTYNMMALLPTLQRLPRDAVLSELSRVLKRATDAAVTGGKTPKTDWIEKCRAYIEACAAKTPPSTDSDSDAPADPETAWIASFVRLCQIVSFLTRSGARGPAPEHAEGASR